MAEVAEAAGKNRQGFAGVWRAFRSWLRGIWIWLRSLTPSGRKKMLEMAHEQGLKKGYEMGVENTLKRFGEMNRQQRRRTMRSIVKEYGE